MTVDDRRDVEQGFVIQGLAGDRRTTAWVQTKVTKRTPGIPTTADPEHAQFYRTRRGAEAGLASWKGRYLHGERSIVPASCGWSVSQYREIVVLEATS